MTDAKIARFLPANAGAGLIWGLGVGFLLWIVIPGAQSLAHFAGFPRGAMLGEARARFPQLLGCIVCVSAPLGLSLGIWGRLQAKLRANAEPFHWGRALSAGGLAGLAAALIFSRWMYQGNFYPLTGGLHLPGTHFVQVLRHFGMACLIGCTFGALFQTDVRNLGSSMAWGMAYTIFWWFVGPMTVFPLLAQGRVDWSAEAANQQFGPLVGHILYGLILGVVYAVFNSAWTRLFVAADPLNRKREGPGVRFLLSVSWGAGAGLLGGLTTLPLMIATGVVIHGAGLGSHLPSPLGIALHLLISMLIGTSYGLLFRGESSTVVFGSLWGFIVGLIWWYAGPLTLLPLIRTGECDWRPETVATLLPSLISHLFFGVITANVFLAFERHNTRRLGPAADQPIGQRGGIRPNVSPAPALWVFILGVGVLFPILLG